MCDATALAQLGAAREVIAAAQKISPFGRDAVDALRIFGIRSGFIRVRDQELYISVQFDAPPQDETNLLRFVRSVFEETDLWRPYVRVGNLRTNCEFTYSWQEFVDRITESRTTPIT